MLAQGDGPWISHHILQPSSSPACRGLGTHALTLVKATLVRQATRRKSAEGQHNPEDGLPLAIAKFMRQERPAGQDVAP